VLPRNLSAAIRQFDPALLFLACLTGVTVLSAPKPQHPASPKNSNDAPSLRITTRLVQINVIVNDKHGNPITGLTQEDFSVFDNGKPQEIRAFSAETNWASDSSRTALPPDTYTNRPEEQTNVPASVTVILLDALNTEAAEQTLARKQVIRVLGEIQPQEYVALYWLGDGLRILHDFTTDASVLRQVLAGYDSKPSRELDNSALADPSLNSPNPSTPAGTASERTAFRLAFDQRVANQSKRERARATVSALLAIANHLGTRKGRKNLVWVSASFPVSLGYDKFDLNWANDVGENFTANVQRAARALTDADIAVYPVDARGLMGSGVTAGGDYSDPPTPEFSGEGNEHLPTRVAPGNLETMKILAERTGGRAFYGTNDISGAIRHAIDDSRVTYTLGYYPAALKWDGSFHELRVKVAAPGAQVRARSGYFALPDAPMPSPQNNRAILAQLAASQLPATGIGLHVRAQAPKAAGDAMLAVEVRIDLHEIQMQQREGRWTAAVQSVFLQLDNAGRVLQADDQSFRPDFDATAYERVLQSGIRDTRQVRVLPRAAQLCVVVRDAATGNVGSIYLPLARYFSDSSKASRSQR
jgi:VWFA-related protein